MFVVVLGSVILVVELELVVRRVEKISSGIGFFCVFSFKSGNFSIFISDISNDRNSVVDRFIEGFDDRDLFFWGKEGIFVGVFENNEIFDIRDVFELGV